MTTPTTDRPAVSRPLMIVLGLVAIAVVAYLLLAGGRSPDVAAVDPAASEISSEVAVPPVEPAEPTEGSPEIAAVEPTFNVFNARDPFDQLVADTTGTDDSVGTTTPTSTTPGTDTSQPSTDTTPGADSGDGAQTTVGTTTIRLDEVFREGGTDKVLVQVNSDGYEAAEGETVAGSLTVLDIEDSCATMRFTDTRFILCEGEQIRK
jgi:hypothetical protein